MLEVKNLKKSYNNKDYALKGISFNINKGDIVGFVGQNGAGKSTAIKSILGIVNYDKESIINVFGMTNKDEDKIKDRIGFVFETNFYEELTLNEASNILSSFYSKWDKSIMEHYLKSFNLPSKRKIKDLSKGMKMKFAIATALSHDAEFLIMDEPTSGLDPFSREEILDILLQINKEKNMTILLSSHIISDIEKISNKVIFINDGEIVLSGLKNDIKSKFLSVKGSLDCLGSDIIDKCIGYKEWNDYFIAVLPSEHKESLDTVKFTIENASLEDIILFHIKGKKNEKTFKII